MYHSITFGNKNTWDDWHLVPSSRPAFNPPSLKEKRLEIPGGNGFIDLTEALTGFPLYQNREGSFEFIVMNDYMEWQEAYSSISDYLHGIKMKAILEDDPYYYYEGRFKVNNWKSDKYYSLITVDYDVAPYKKRILPVNIFLPITTVKTKNTIRDDHYGRAPVCPTITISTGGLGDTTFTFLNTSLGISIQKVLSDGTYQFPEIVMYGDHVSFTITGEAEGSMDISCEYGRL